MVPLCLLESARHVETKWAPIQRLLSRWHSPSCPRICERDVVSDDDVSTRHVARDTASYPDCHRQSYRLSAEPHQSPIRIKAWDGSPLRIPLPSIAPQFPRQLCGPDRVHHMQAQDVWLPGGAIPFMAHGRGRLSQTPVAMAISWLRLRLIANTGPYPNPLVRSKFHPWPSVSSKMHGRDRTELARSSM